MNKILMSWSGGKDSTMALLELQRAEWGRVSTLLTTITEDYDRISIHGVQRALLQRQAESLGLPLQEVRIPKNSTNEEYETRMIEALADHRTAGTEMVAFGDLFLEDIRKYREELLGRVRMRALFPVWHWDTRKFVETFVALGFKAIITCVNSKVLDRSFSGKMIDKDFLSALPTDVDPCGENGEFHTFVYGGPLFKEEVRFHRGEIVLRDEHYYCDLLPD